MASHHKAHMKHKHHRKARGGAMAHRDDYAGSGDPNVAKEAREMKHGGKVHGHKGHHRIHKKRGGGVGADKHPFSSAYTKGSEAT